PRKEGVKELEDISEFWRLEIQHFFETYKDLEPGKSVEGAHWVGREEAEKTVLESIERAKANGVTTARWTMPSSGSIPEPEDVTHSEEDIKAAAARARELLATEESPLSDEE